MPTEWQSQAGQDRIVDWLFPSGGFYIEIGAGDPVQLSNTAALESLGWRGIAVEKDEVLVKQHANARTHKCIHADALTIDWVQYLPEIPERVEYLSVDVDDDSLPAMANLFQHGVRPQFVTFEHNRYYAGDTFAFPARRFMANCGYDLLCADVRLLDRQLGEYPFEDWFALPETAARAGAIRCHDIDWRAIHRLVGFTPAAPVL